MQVGQGCLFFRSEVVREVFGEGPEQGAAMVAGGGVLDEFGGESVAGGEVIEGQAGSELAKGVVAGAVRSGGRVHLYVRELLWLCEQAEAGTMEIEQAVAAGRAALEVRVNTHGLIGLVRIRSRAGRSIPVVFNLSTAQMLRLFIHWTHFSLYERNSGDLTFSVAQRKSVNERCNAL
ncbi:MAG TPA: hypothetical protein VIK39_04685 [Candidatus Angelobacter sp.]